MGAPKGLLVYQGKTLLEHFVESYQKAGGMNILVSVGIHAKLYQKMNLPVNFVVNDKPHLGQFYSLQLLLKNATSNYFFVTPIDLISPPYEFWRQMLIAGTLIKPSYQGRAGHPILFNQSVKDEILKNDHSSRLDHLLKNFSSYNVEIDWPSVLGNLNTPSDI